MKVQDDSPVCDKHCFCRSRTEAVDPMRVATRRVRYCCWCGTEQTRRSA